jgi:hypothetical protein
MNKQPDGGAGPPEVRIESPYGVRVAFKAPTAGMNNREIADFLGGLGVSVWAEDQTKLDKALGKFGSAAVYFERVES